MAKNKIRYSVPTNWQEDLLEELSAEDVVEVYGRLKTDFVGGGEMSDFNLPPVTREEISKHVAHLHNLGFEFNYLLNASCLDNLEWTRKGQKKLRNLLDWLVDIKTDTVTVTMPYLLEMIKDSYPVLKVMVSSFAGIDTVLRAKHWLNLGADGIALASYKINRDFRLLDSFRKNIPCRLQLIANEGCLYSCPMYSYHANIISHHAQSFHPSSALAFDVARPFCTSLYLCSPESLIRANWIRPEDIKFYEELGIDRIRLVSGEMSSQAICSIVLSYTSRSSPDNLYQLFPEVAHQEGIYIANRALDGFLNYFREGKCSGSCRKCGYCKEIAQRAVKIDPLYRERVLEEYRDKLSEVAPEFLMEERRE